MTEDAIDQVGKKLQRNTTLISIGLGFIVMFALTLTVTMMWAMFHIGQNSSKIEQLGLENRSVLCAMKRETEIRLRIFAVDSKGIMPEKIRIPLELSYRATLATFTSIDCKG